MSLGSLLVGVHHVDANAAATDAGDQCPQRGRGAAPVADHLAQIVGVNMHFHSASAPIGHHGDPDIVGVVDDAAHQMLNRVDDDGIHRTNQFSDAASVCSPPSADCSGLSASAVLSASAAFLAGAFFFGVAASVVGAPSASASAELNSSSLLGLGARVFNLPSAPGSPLNFCQSPVIFSSFRTGSVG